MHATHSIGAALRRSRNSAIRAAVLAVLVAGGCAAALAAAAGDAEVTASRGAHPAPEMQSAAVEPGAEALELAARLVQGGGLIERPVFWSVSRSDGEKIYEGEIPVADFQTEPGDYDITARYGTVTSTFRVGLGPAERLRLVFVLNVGGIRVLPRVGNIVGLPAAEVGIFRNGVRVAVSSRPGEIIRVAAGRYHVQSRFRPGNVAAETDIVVSAGRMRAVEIAHQAGLARLVYLGQSVHPVRWAVTDPQGRPLAAMTGGAVTLVLSPGRYSATAMAGGRRTTASFDIGAGETETIVIRQ